MSFAYLSLKTMNEFNEINFKCVKTYIIDIQNTENIEVKVALFEKEENEFISSLYVENEMLRQFVFLTYVWLSEYIVNTMIDGNCLKIE